MENENIVLLRHHPMNVKYTNTFYTNQCDHLEDYIIVDVTSRCVRNKQFMKEHPTFARDISPFYIGPVVGEDGVKCNIFEIFWQCSKVYPCHDSNGAPNEEWLKWRNEYFSKESCTKNLMRHANESLGYEHKDCLYTVVFDKKLNKYITLNYIEARKKVYFKEYAKLVYNTESFKWLKGLVDSGKKIAFVDFDAFNYYSDNAKRKRYESYVEKCKKDNNKPSLYCSDFLCINSIKDVINFALPAGHSVVLKALLQGDLKVDENGNLIDPSGILN